MSSSLAPAWGLSPRGGRRSPPGESDGLCFLWLLWNSLSFLPTPPRPISTPLVNIALTFHHLFVQRAPDTPARGPRRLPPPPGSRLPRITPRGQAAGSSLPHGPRQPCTPPLPGRDTPTPTSCSHPCCQCPRELCPQASVPALWPAVPGTGPGFV